MKIRHKTHGWAPDRTDPAWAERVEREAERITNHAEARWHKAQRRLAKAIQRAERQEARPEVSRAKVDRLWDVVEQRRADLRDLHKTMRASAAGSQHRGKGSYRGVTNSEPL